MATVAELLQAIEDVSGDPATLELIPSASAKWYVHHPWEVVSTARWGTTDVLAAAKFLHWACIFRNNRLAGADNESPSNTLTTATQDDPDGVLAYAMEIKARMVAHALKYPNHEFAMAT